MQGPGTAELVGLGGESTWEVLDSIENYSEEEMAGGAAGLLSLEAQPKTKPKRNSSSLSKTPEAERGDSASEEEDTIQLTNPDLGGAVKKKQHQPSSEHGGGGEGENGSKRLVSKKRTSEEAKSASKPARKGRRKGRGGGGGGGGEPVSAGKGKRGQTKR